MPDLPIIGIEPALKPATLMFVNPRIIVMATPLTLKEEKFLALCEKFGGDSEIIPLPCGGLVEIIESGETDGLRVNLYLESIFAPYKDEKIDALVLGCTHYPHIINAIRKYIPKETVILDGGEGTARETYRRLFIAELLNDSEREGQVEIINTSGNEEMIDLSWRLLGR
jgi:glutamate racemase